MKKLIQQPGHCPKCNSENLDYQDSEELDKSIIYEFTCADCGIAGKECYDLVFVETLIV